MNRITRGIRELIRKHGNKDLKEATERYFRNPDLLPHSEKDHLAIIGFRFLTKLNSLRSRRAPLDISIIDECVYFASDYIEWHLIINKGGNLIEDDEVTLLEVHDE